MISLQYFMNFSILLALAAAIIVLRCKTPLEAIITKRIANDKTVFIEVFCGVLHNFRYTEWWHFMMGEFLPVIYEIAQSRADNVHIMRIGNASKIVNYPIMNQFYLEIGEAIPNFNIHDESTNVVNQNRWRRAEKWDYGFNSNEERVSKIRIAVEWLKKWAGEDRENSEVIFQSRKSGSKEDLNNHGPSRRRITNYEECFEEYRGDKRMVFANGTLRQQILQYMGRRVLVLVHGAGMLHSLWMGRNLTVIEIIPTNKLNNRGYQPCHALERFENFGLIGHLERIVVKDDIDAVDCRELLNAIDLFK